MDEGKKYKASKIFFEHIEEHWEPVMQSIKSKALEENRSFEEVYLEKRDSIYEIFNDELSTLYFQFNKFDLNEFFNNHVENQRKIVEINKGAFHYFFMYLNSTTLIYDKVSEVIKDKEKQMQRWQNLALYGLIIRRSYKIGTLLIDGHIDGAMIIWRSMYEYIIILLLLLKEDNEKLSTAFLEHSTRNDQNNIESYKLHSEVLKFKPVPKETEEILSKKRVELENKYGKFFLKNDYGWADSLFPKSRKATLRDMEFYVGMSRYRPYYLLCSERIHSSFSGFKTYIVDKKVILPKIVSQEYEPGNFTDPLQYTIAILEDINRQIMEEFCEDSEIDINLKLLRKINDAMHKEFDTNH